MITVVVALGAVVGAAFAVTFLVDPQSVRDRLVGELQQQLDQPVVVRGGADLTLLPTPTLSVARVTLGSPTPGEGPGFVEIDRVDLDIAPASLLGDRLEITGIRLVRPTLRANPAAGVGFPALPEVLASTGTLRRLTVVDGRLLATDGGALALDAVEVDLRRAETGEVTGSVRGDWQRRKLALEIEAGAIAPGRISTVALQASLDRVASATFAGGVRPDATAPQLTGRIELAAPAIEALHAPLEALLGRAPWTVDGRLGPFRLAGALALEAGRWSLAEASLTLGGASVAGSAVMDLDAASLDLDLEAESLQPDEPALRAAFDLLGSGLATPGLAGRLRGRVETLPWRGGALRDLRLDAGFDGAGRLAIQRLAARLPGEGELAFAGSLTGLPSAPGAQGQLSVSTAELPALLPMLGLPEPAAPERLRSLNGSASVDATPAGFTLRDLDLQLDATRLSGSLALARGDRPQLAAVLQLDRLTLDGYLPDPADLPGRLAAFGQEVDLALNLSIGSLGWQSVRAEGVRLRGEVVAGRMALEELAIEDLAEAAGRLSGTADLASGDAELSLDAAALRPARLARLLDLDPPAVLSRFAPVAVKATLRRVAGVGTVSADVAATGVDLALTAELPAAAFAWPDALALQARAESFAELLGQLGLPGRAGPAFAGGATLDLDLNRADDGALAIGGSLGLGPGRIVFDLTHASDGQRPSLAGTMVTERFDPALLQAAYEAGELALGLPPGPLARWPGSWPDQALPFAAIGAADLDLAVRAGSPDSPVVLALRQTREALSLDASALPAAGGRLTGRLEARPDAGIALRASLVDADAAALLDPLGLRQDRLGRVDLELDATARGPGLLDLVGSLAGDGRLALRDGVLDGLRLEAGETGFDAPQTRIQALTGTFAIEAGLVTADALALRLAGGEATVDARLDLPAWRLDATVRTDGAGPLRLAGPPGEIRKIEAAP